MSRDMIFSVPARSFDKAKRQVAGRHPDDFSVGTLAGATRLKPLSLVFSDLRRSALRWGPSFSDQCLIATTQLLRTQPCNKPARARVSLNSGCFWSKPSQSAAVLGRNVQIRASPLIQLWVLPSSTRGR